MILKSLLLVVVLVCLCFCLTEACKSLEELDSCGYNAIFVKNRDMPVPVNDSDVLLTCSTTQPATACLAEDAAACMPEGPYKQTTLAYLGSMAKMLKEECDSPQLREGFRLHVQCFRDKAKVEPVRRCADSHQLMMEKVATLPAEQRLATVCCTELAVRQCLITRLTANCDLETGTYFDNIIKLVTKQSSQMMCAPYSSMASCDAQAGPAWPQLKTILEAEDPVATFGKLKWKSVVPVLMQIVKQQ